LEELSKSTAAAGIRSGVGQLAGEMGNGTSHDEITSRILEGWGAYRGLVEPLMGIGSWKLDTSLCGKLEAVGPAAGPVVDARDLNS
jgi:hypothetical protein